MRFLRRVKALMMIGVLLLGMLAVPGGTPTAEAAGKVTVKKITSVDALTGSTTIYLAKGKKATLKTTVTVTPDKSANKKVTFKSSNPKVATVTSKGDITGKKEGTAKITVTSQKNSKKMATVMVHVVKGKVTGIQLNETSGTLIVGDTVKLKTAVKATKGGKKDVVWTSSDEKVATVKKGTVKAVGEGKATITVKAADGSGKKATYKVVVASIVTLKNTKGKNASDVAVLQRIISKQIALGAKISKDLEASYIDSDGNKRSVYTWDKNGRLKKISWPNCKLKGTLSCEGLSALTSLNCHRNELTSLNMSKNTVLTSLDCSNNQLSKLDVSKNTALTELRCYDNQLSKLDVSKNTALTELWCAGNQLTSLEVSECTALTTLWCYDNELTSLDVSGCTALTRLYCYYNQLTSLDVSECTALIDLICHSNQLKSLDVSKHTALIFLDCGYNQLSSLNVSGCIALMDLFCQNNQLKSLDLTDCKKLIDSCIYCDEGVIIIRNTTS